VFMNRGLIAVRSPFFIAEKIYDVRSTFELLHRARRDREGGEKKRGEKKPGDAHHPRPNLRFPRAVGQAVSLHVTVRVEAVYGFMSR